MPMSSLLEIANTLLDEDRQLERVAQKLSGKRVLLRADLNVPIVGKAVSDSTRIEGLMPTLRLLSAHHAKVIIISHLGRPEPGKQSLEEMQQEFSLAPVAHQLQSLLGPEIFKSFVNSCNGTEVEAAVGALQPGQVILLENTRFHKGDTANDADFAKALAQHADVYVCDAFGVIHRAQASVTGIVDHVPCSYPGLLIRHELKFLIKTLYEPVRPLCVIIGGSKVADKIGVLWSLIQKADVILIGGRMAFTFLAAKGVSVGATHVETGKLQEATELLEKARVSGVQMLLPCDVTVSSSLDEPVNKSVTILTRNCCTKECPCIPAGQYGMDIGPATQEVFVNAMAHCKTVFWNGPLGKFEVPAFSEGTNTIAKEVAAMTKAGVTTVVGGGDSAAAVTQLNLSSSFSHISTGGGASLELLEGKMLPGLVALATASTCMP